MPMRTDCTHYASRTTQDGLVETCRIGATDETGGCAADCATFETRPVTIVGWEQGSAAVPLAPEPTPPDADEAALLAELASLVDESGEAAVSAEAERRRAEQRRAEKRKRRRIR
ncbi:MAG: hypothetical protein IT198_08925 [Acidimicrobiia bacterium]|nr:hypothetical protein [Acidimicrobiia bacterium]